MNLVRHLILCAWLLCGILPGLAANTSARLVLSHESARVGETVWAGIHLKMAPGWHTYWQNGGDSGAATQVEWKLPDGISAGEILWPTPEKYSSAGLNTFVYHDEVTLLVPLSIGRNAIAGDYEIRAKV